MKENVPIIYRTVRLSIFTQYYPPDYAATGQLIEELAVELSKFGLSVQIFTGQPGYAFQNKSAPAIERSKRVLIQRSRTARIWPKRIRGKAVNGILFCPRSIFYLLKLILNRSKGKRGEKLKSYPLVVSRRVSIAASM